jgi:hypothetical protein
MELWFILAYVVGTVFGAWMGYKFGVRTGADITIMSLCESGFLKHKIAGKEVEIIKFDEEFSQ